MDKNDYVDELAHEMAKFVTDYAEAAGLDHGDVMNALGRLYVTYGFTVKSSKVSNEELGESLVEFVDANCNLMVEALRHAEKA